MAENPPLIVDDVIIPFPVWTWRNRVARWLSEVFIRTLFRVNVVGSEHVPKTGGCLVICNHLSYADGIIVMACLPRPGRFLVDNKYVRMPFWGFPLRLAGVIPVEYGDRRRALVAAIEAAVAAAQRGEVVVIFPEGKITRNGQMDTFQRGMERIATRANIPIIPAHLHGLWGSVASRADRTKLPRFRPRIELRLAPPEAPTLTAAQARDRVIGLSYEAAQTRSNTDFRTLGRQTISHARRSPFRIAVREHGGSMTYWQLVGAARAVLPLLNLSEADRCVGILLPPGRAGTLINLAIQLSGRTTVNINHTAGEKHVARMCEMAGVHTIITADAYTKRIGNPVLPGRILTCELLLKNLPKWRVFISALSIWCMPKRWLDRSQCDDIATIVFSSGSTGDPKGVELTHRQILANLHAVHEALDLRPHRDIVCNPLPLFHSFGLIIGHWMTLSHGLTQVAHPDPTDSDGIGTLVTATKATMIMTAPTFVRGWMRRITPEQFKSLRLVVTGAERCPAELHAAFKERYNMNLLEGYGCTELAPTAAVSLPAVTRNGFTEHRSRDRSVGRALPGLHIFAVDPETKEKLPPNTEGLLIVRSPARMRSYLGRPDLTERAFIHGGYNTGDIGKVDEDGFVFITGRLARFAKIAGEMVPLDNVQAALSAIAAESEVVVSAVPDPNRGERLIVMHTGVTGGADALLKALDEQPALWRPKAKDIYLVESIPKLGTGKLDLARVKQLAWELSGDTKAK